MHLTKQFLHTNGIKKSSKVPHKNDRIQCMENKYQYYEIQYKSVWDSETDWSPSGEAGDNKFSSYIEASKKARELLTQDHMMYRVVTKIVTEEIEELKRFTSEFPKV